MNRVFQGNSDCNTVLKNAFPEATVCRFIRLLPISWNGRIALRMELYGDPPIMDPDVANWECKSLKCYHFAGPHTWEKAKEYCSNLSGVPTITGDKEPSLLYVETDEEIRDINETGWNLTSGVWINCHKETEGELICDVDGEGTLQNTDKWLASEPDGSEDENCIAIPVTGETDQMSSGWVDEPCQHHCNTICQIFL
nr:uncharacterized protein LOC129261872 [Lytechinus pictus]